MSSYDPWLDEDMDREFSFEVDMDELTAEEFDVLIKFIARQHDGIMEDE